jgi:hypothetical protein
MLGLWGDSWQSRVVHDAWWNKWCHWSHEQLPTAAFALDGCGWPDVLCVSLWRVVVTGLWLDGFG